jgi:hypothetical protein
MDITGPGFTAYKQFKISSFKVSTTLALQWAQGANGDWYPTDRGSGNDYYDTTVTMQGRYDELKDILVEINNNRFNGSNELTLSNFVSDEKIFGADIIYTGTLTATITDFPQIKQKSLNFFNITMSMRLLKPYTFTDVETMPTLNLSQTGYESGVQDFTITKYDTYKNSFTYLEESNDAGIFKGNFILSSDDLARLRRYHAINRGSNFTISDIPGVFQPFGPNGQQYTIDCRIKSILNEKMRDTKYWFVDIELVNYKVKNV